MLAWIFFIYTRLTYGMAAFENRNLFLETGHRSNTPGSLFFRVATNRSLMVLFFIITDDQAQSSVMASAGHQ